MAAILNSAILDSATLVFPLKLTHACQDWFPPFAQKRLHSHFHPHHLHIKNLHSFILTQLDDGSHLEFCHVGLRHLVFFSQIPLKKHSPSTLILTQTNLIWLKLIHSHSTWWWQPSWILPCWIQTLQSWIETPSYLLSDSLKNTLPPLWLFTQTNSIWLKINHSHSTW